MNADETEIRTFLDGDEIALNQAWNRERGDSRSLDEWSWRYPASTAGRVISLGLGGGQIQAHCGGAPVSVRAGGREYPTMIVRDLFSGSGDDGEASILARTVEAFLAEARAAGGMVLAIDSGMFGPAREVLNSNEWTPITAGVETLVREDRPSSPMRRLLYRAELARDWEPRLDGLWRRVRDAYPLAVVRDAALALRQRSGHPRLRFHRFLVFPRLGRRAVAWVVFESGGGICRWMDLVWDHRHPGALEMVAHLSGRYCVQMGVEVEKIALGGDSPAVERLRRLGFDHDPDDDLSVRAFVSGSGERLIEKDQPVYLTELELDRF